MEHNIMQYRHALLRKKSLYLIISLLLVLVLFYLSLSLGTSSFSLSQIIEALTNKGNSDYFAINEYRLPRAILAIFVGMGFAISGLMIQNTLNNDLASGETLGINNSAGLFSVLALTLFPSFAQTHLPLFALIGGLLSFAILWFVIKASSLIHNLIIIGVALATFYASITNFLILSFKLDISSTLVWLTGSLWGRTWTQIYIYLPWLLAFILLGLGSIKILKLYLLGDVKVQNLGYDVNKYKILILFLATIISSLAVSITGPISFLGLIAPHIAKRIYGNISYLILYMSTALIGAILLQSADILARIIKPPVEFPTGVLTAVIGAPYFFYLIIRKRG
ncbi:iron chelate uptake ABC transporter family permease subunit [Psittacicella hinzii]|uniref:Iron complex transport system permease protein n=1 Tax=Psittacicella hinzii TaxID=2028575 RepID=A0A3A1YD95_9GAMM|nr:iron chelate uptake ABC transporter family permease subunit [Psittacicella hinzii]RIY36213.1 hypothetical protein CKF58_06120 [Psittacicella hinzii]